MASVTQYLGTGRRKKSVARVRLVPGTGVITINKRDIDDYFGYETLKMIVRDPLKLTDTLGKFDVLGRLFNQNRVLHDSLHFPFDLRSQTLPGLRAGSGRALGGTAGWWCAVYRSMDLHYIHLSINKLLIFFVIIRVVLERENYRSGIFFLLSRNLKHIIPER